MKALKAFGVFCVVVFFGACHGQGNTPTGTGATSLPGPVIAVDGRTGSSIDLGGLSAVNGQAVTATASDFFTLKTTWTGNPFVLWPMDEYLPAQYTRGLIYDRQDPGTLMRWPAATTMLTIAPIGIDGQGLERVSAAADLVSRARPSLAVVVGTSGAVIVNLSVDPSDSGFQIHPHAAALTYQYQRNGVLTAARIVFRYPLNLEHFYTWDNVRTALAHEMGHATGLAHLDPSGEQGIMAASSLSYDYPDFTDREKLVMKLQYQRRPGTRLSGTVEDEASASSQSRDSWHLVSCTF